MASARQLDWLLRNILGATYPKKTLDRRLALLRPNEYEKIHKYLNSIEEAVEKIDEIICRRAELEKDPWP